MLRNRFYVGEVRYKNEIWPSRSRSAVNLNKAYVPGLDAPSSTFVGRPLRADPFDGGLAKSKDSRKCGTCSFMPAFV
jgi:hypothetical protein